MLQEINKKISTRDNPEIPINTEDPSKTDLTYITKTLKKEEEMISNHKDSIEVEVNNVLTLEKDILNKEDTTRIG